MTFDFRKLIPPTDSHFVEVLKSSALALVLRALGAALAFFLNVVIARSLGVDGAGVYFLALSLVMIGAVVSKLGLDNTILRFVAHGASIGDWNKVLGVFRMGMRLAAGASLAAAGAMFIFAPLIAERIFSEEELGPTLRAMSLGVLTYAMMTLLAESLKGLKQIFNAMLTSGVLYPGIALVVIWPLTHLFGTPGAALAFVLSTGLTAIIGWTMWRRHMTGVAAPSPAFDRAVMFRSCLPLWTVSIINRGIMRWAPLFLLGIWGTSDEAGIFGAAWSVAMLVTFFLTAVNSVIAPKFSELHARGEIEGLGRLARRFSLLITLATSPLFFVLILAGDWVMALFGPDFTRGGTALAILATGQAVNAITGPQGNILMMTGHERDVRNASILAVMLMAILAALLIPDHGMLGAATASAAAAATQNVYTTITVYLRLGILAIPLVGK